MSEGGSVNGEIPPMANSGIPNVLPVVAVQSVPVNHAEKPEKFNGANFKRWQQKMHFYLSTLHLARFLTEDAPHIVEGQASQQEIDAVNAWNNAEYAC
ncbi:hypothetical protein LINPERPRIM_LOCUS4853, partial [Linum perenne]